MIPVDFILYKKLGFLQKKLRHPVRYVICDPNTAGNGNNPYFILRNPHQKHPVKTILLLIVRILPKRWFGAGSKIVRTRK